MTHRSGIRQAFRERYDASGGALTALVGACLLLLASCQAPGPVADASAPRRVTPPPAAAIRTEPQLRIRIVADTPRVTLTARGPLTIGPTAAQHGAANPRPFTPPVTVSRRGGQFVLSDATGQTLAWGLAALEITPPAGSAIGVNNTSYPGSIVLHPVRTPAGYVTDRIDVVNHVAIERYLPGVLEHELYPSWAPEAYVAQALAARSYAIAQQARFTNRHYDLESTVASQVYGGAAKNPKAIDAVNRTRGQVLVYGGRIVPAYFSSCAGGVGQDAAAAFSDAVDMPPLRGRTHGWGSTSKNFRWGPITRDVNEVSQRIAAWGRANSHAVANLGTLVRVEVIQRSSTGRPAWFRLTDHRRRNYVIGAEHFRFACNYVGGGLAKLADAQTLKSSNVDVAVRGSTVHFTNGRGFGHGVGLCQWSAQEMAAAGHSGYAIASFFYPGASIEKLY